VPKHFLLLPTKFDGASKLNQADLWPEWPRCVEIYRIVYGLQNETVQEQLGTPLHAIGECDGDIVTTLREYDVRARLSSQVHEVEEDDDELFFPGEINSASTDYWRGQIELNSHNTLFKLDTGSAVTVLSDNAQWLRSVDVTETSHTLRGPGISACQLKVTSIQRMLEYGHTCITESVFVLNNQTYSLLSRKACVELGLIMRAEKDEEEVHSGPTDWVILFQHNTIWHKLRTRHFPANFVQTH